MLTRKKDSTTPPGYTLVEIMLVIALIGVLLGIMVDKFSGTLADTRDTRRKADLKRMEGALTAYYFKNRSYPDSGGGWYSSEMGDAVPNGNTNDGNWIPGLAPTYIPKLPKEPKGGRSEFPACVAAGFKRSYLYRSDRQSFKLLAACSPENPWTFSDPFFDPLRPVTSWMVCSGPPACGW